ncbi:hypothetical protein A0H81_11519 [Grifola frondosa]|uniref:Homeobox domain-containing protein n=1 Tax=Grifola frondosa TaxID=5627 RepID=A0A1C7LUU4_GRIFR|nr:hypothetical protein A0H81_11519 [Grifola frondosa]
MRSVTVWFQNKRQTERRIALSSATDAALSSPFSAAVSGQTIHTAHRRTPSIASTMASPGRASIERERPRLHGSALTGARRPSLDHIAARIERPNPLTRSHTAPELSPPRPRTPDRPLWENMPSSPTTPNLVRKWTVCWWTSSMHGGDARSSGRVRRRVLVVL